MRSGPRACFAAAFFVFATLAIVLLVLRPAVAWASPTPATAGAAGPTLTLTCDSPWERLTASPTALIRSADESAFPGDRCGAAIASRQELASGATLAAAVFALFFAATMLPRPRFRPRRSTIADAPISWR